MILRQEYFEYSDCHYRMANPTLRYHQKGIHASDSLTKLTYLASAVSHLLVSTDHLLNWFLYPNVFKSRNARYSSFESARKVKRGLSRKKQECVITHPFTIEIIRNRLWYLSSQKSIKDAVNDLTIKEVNKLFEEADYVRKILETL
ncbi:MAG: hypothetical protein ACE5J3_03035 [Methanosarcinales archaeon]